MNDNEDIKNILKEILKWTKFEGMQKVKQVLESTLDNDDKKLIYELSDGRSSSAIARIAGVSGQTVLNYWKKWVVLGIVEIHPEHTRRYQRIFSLKEVGIEVPQVEESAETKEETVEGDEE